MEIEDRVLINRIIEVLEMPGEDLSDGECLDEIFAILTTKYTINTGRD